VKGPWSDDGNFSRAGWQSRTPTCLWCRLRTFSCVWRANGSRTLQVCCSHTVSLGALVTSRYSAVLQGLCLAQYERGRLFGNKLRLQRTKQCHPDFGQNSDSQHYLLGALLCTQSIAYNLPSHMWPWGGRKEGGRNW
jgi:hypothetical protein